MIISHKLQCIYIKLAKVAGTSFEIALSKYCGADDIITPIISKESPAIRRTLGFRDAQNYKDPHTQRNKFRNHIDAISIRKLIPKDIWDNYLKVATIRCPYDMLISHYYFILTQVSRQRGFEEFIVVGKHKKLFERIYNLHKKKAEKSTGIKRLLTDFLIRYEHLDKDIKELEIRINCPGLLNTFQSITAKRGIRPQIGTAAYEMYSKYPAAKTAVDERCNKAAKEYEFFSRYWPAYKSRLEDAIKEHGACSGVSNLYRD